MASPESSGRIGGARASNNSGVKNLLAMFEKGSSAPSSPNSAPVTRELSPGPRPLSKVRTSFVAIGGKEGQAGFGLQKLPTTPVSPAGDASFASPFGPKLNNSVGNSSTEKQETTRPKEVEKEPIKKDVSPAEAEELKSERTTPTPTPTPTPSLAPKPDTTKIVHKEEEESSSMPPNQESKQTNTEPTKEKIPTKESPKKTTKSDPKHSSSTSKTQPQLKPALVSKGLKSSAPKNLIVPTPGSKISSPLPSPRSPGRPGHARKPSASTDIPRKPKSTPSTTTSTAKAPPKPRQPAITRPRPTTTHKPVPKPEPKDTTKPADLKGSAFAPTASWVAKHGGSSAESSLSRRPPSSAATARKSRSTDRTIRRQNSTISDRTRDAAIAANRPATSAATRPTRSSESSGRPDGSSVPVPSNDFLSRMMRPTKSSASKVHDKTDVTKYSRSGSSAGRRTDSRSPPRTKTVHSASPKRLSREIPTFRMEIQSEANGTRKSPSPAKAAASVESQQAENSEPESIPEEEEEFRDPKVEISEKIPIQDPTVKDLTGHETTLTPEKSTPELTVNTIDSGDITSSAKEDNGIEEEGQTPSTTSSATLVHDEDTLDVMKGG